MFRRGVEKPLKPGDLIGVGILRFAQDDTLRNGSKKARPRGPRFGVLRTLISSIRRSMHLIWPRNGRALGVEQILLAGTEAQFDERTGVGNDFRLPVIVALEAGEASRVA